MIVIPAVISDFKGKYSFLSNFHICDNPIFWDGNHYYSSEAAFQAAKTLDKTLRQPIMEEKNPGTAKKLGRLLPLREDWEEVRQGIMKEILEIKFSILNPNLNYMLKQTKDHYLIEGNLWHDNYWGYCYCKKCIDLPKHNKLGKILMEVREKV